MAETLIVKVQVSLVGEALIYDQTRNYRWRGTVSPELQRQVGPMGKGFFHAEVTSEEPPELHRYVGLASVQEGKTFPAKKAVCFKLGEVAPWQDW